MLMRCVFALQLCLLLAATSDAADQYFYSDGHTAYYCKRPVSYHTGCYVVRDNTNIVRVDSFPVISSGQAASMIQSCGSCGPASPVSPAGSIAACCGAAPTGSCQCKTLGCEITLNPANCQQQGVTQTTPIPYVVLGTIPMVIDTQNCLKEIKRFDYATMVPTISCTTVTCVEIGTKTIQCEVGDCKPGCSFNVCIPINDCVTKKVECKLVPKEMHHVIYERTDPSIAGVVYDVYVINAPVGDPFNAGGMPTQWVVMHCATRAALQAKFPNMIASNKGKNIESKSTEADVDIELAIDRDQLMQYVAQFEAASTGEQGQAESEPEDAAAIDDEDRAKAALLKAPSSETPALNVVAELAG